MTEAPYYQFCPVAMASEILSTRWTLLLIQEILSGSRRFNDIRRGVPRMSPALLSKRLKELETAGLLIREQIGKTVAYYPTEAAEQLTPILRALGTWSQRWLDTCPSADYLDVQLLMWNIRRNFEPDPLPKKRVTIQFIYPELGKLKRNWWLIVEPNAETDLCSLDPGFDVDLYVSANLASMTSAWIGPSTLSAEIEAGRILLIGDTSLASSLKKWLKPSYFAATWDAEANHFSGPRGAAQLLQQSAAV